MIHPPHPKYTYFPVSQGTCWSDPTKYTGQMNVSVNGNKCINWTDEPLYDYHASKYPDNTVSEASNFCRSPSGYPSLWCLTGGGNYEFCGAPPCFGNYAAV